MEWGDFDPQIFDRQGNPISYEEWERLKFEVEDYDRIALTIIGPYRVSTVWLGIDHGFGRGPRRIFETMIFNDDGVAEPDGLDLFTDRYPTEELALARHDQVVAMLKEHYAKRAATTSPERLLTAVPEPVISEQEQAADVPDPDHC